jgi:hypothetical protein
MGCGHGDGLSVVHVGGKHGYQRIDGMDPGVGFILAKSPGFGNIRKGDEQGSTGICFKMIVFSLRFPVLSVVGF